MGQFQVSLNLYLTQISDLNAILNSNSTSISHPVYISSSANDNHEIQVAVLYMVFQSFRRTYSILNSMGTWELVIPSLTCFSIFERFIRLRQTANV